MWVPYLEALDAGRLAGLLQLVVDPGDDLALDDGVAGVSQPRQHGQSVRSHQLPDQRCGKKYFNEIFLYYRQNQQKRSFLKHAPNWSANRKRDSHVKMIVQTTSNKELCETIHTRVLLYSHVESEELTLFHNQFKRSIIFDDISSRYAKKQEFQLSFTNITRTPLSPLH